MKYKKFVEAQKVEVDDEDKTMVDTKKKNTDKKEDPAATKTSEKEKKKKEEEESVNEAIDYIKVSKELDTYAKKHGGIDKSEFEKAAAYVRTMGRNSSLSVLDKAGKRLNMLFKNADTDVRDRLQLILTKGGFKVGDGYIMRESVDLEEQRDGRSTTDLIKSFFDRHKNKKKYEKAVRLFLDMRKKNPGESNRMLRKVGQMTGLDIRTIDKTLRDMVKDGAMPKHLLNYPTLQMEAKSGDKEAYQKFFQDTLKKFGVKSPAELDDKKEKEFYNYIDKNWKSDDEMSEKYRKPTQAEIDADKKKDQKGKGRDSSTRYRNIKSKMYGNAMGGLKEEAFNENKDTVKHPDHHKDFSSSKDRAGAHRGPRGNDPVELSQKQIKQHRKAESDHDAAANDHSSMARKARQHDVKFAHREAARAHAAAGLAHHNAMIFAKKGKLIRGHINATYRATALANDLSNEARNPFSENVTQVDEATMADRQVMKAVRVAKDMAGNHTGATKRIEAMKKGLSDHPKVRAALQQYNESVEEARAPKIKMNRGPWTMREISDALKDVKMTGRQKDSFIYALKTGSSDEPRLGKKMLKGPFSKKDVDAAMKKSGLDKSLKRGQFGLALQKVGLDMFGNKIKEGTEYATFAERTEMRMGDLKAKIQHYKTTDGMTEADLEALATRLGISAVKLRTLLDEEE